LALLRGDAHVDLVLCDIAYDIGALVRALAAERIVVPVVACGVRTTAEAAARAIRDGAREFLPLPPDPELIAAILDAAAADGHALIVRDPVMAATLRRADQVAMAEASVLITGESGTGKEVLAQYIHRHSRRAAGPFVALNCAAIPETLLESELFGHERGAFSGAVARRIGKFEAADGGTLLLDEISEMDIRLQAKLLRTLQEREIDRLGGSGPVKVNVRILATTNRDLPAEVARGGFREDLYFRLNVVTLRIPPLRERRGDIAPLAEHFAQRYAEVNGLPARPLTAAALRRLAAHAWRGNVRELENTLHRAVLLAEGDTIDVDAIELTPGAAASHVEPAMAGADGVAALVGRRMDDVERDLILQTLAHTLGNRTHAATILGISIRALRNKLHDYTAQGALVPPPASGMAA
jgi:DNA-binding NtrC family response regulator